MIEAETCRRHRFTLNTINIHNTSCVLTCESLLLICVEAVSSLRVGTMLRINDTVLTSQYLQWLARLLSHSKQIFLQSIIFPF